MGRGSIGRVAVRSRAALAVAAVACAIGTAAPARAVVPVSASYQARITGTVSEWNSLIPGYQVTGNVDLQALLFVEQRRSAARLDSPVVGLFTGGTPALDNRPGAIAFATNSQGFHVDPNVLGPTAAAIDVATVQANVAAGTLAATVDENAARTVTVELFRTSSSFISAPAQILAGTLTLTFSADARTVTGSFDLGGNGLIEPGNPLFRVRRYTATVAGTASSAVVLPDGGGQRDEGELVLRGLSAPRGGLATARTRGIAVAIDCPGACTAHATLRVSRGVRRRAGLERAIVGTAEASRSEAGQLAFRVRLTRAARRRLAALDRVAVVADVRVASGDLRRAFERTLTLKRAR